MVGRARGGVRATCSNCRRRPATEVVHDEGGSKYCCAWCVPRARGTDVAGRSTGTDVVIVAATVALVLGLLLLLARGSWIGAPGPFQAGAIGAVVGGRVPQALDRSAGTPIPSRARPGRTSVSPSSEVGSIVTASSVGLPHGGGDAVAIPARAGSGAPGEPGLWLHPPGDVAAGPASPAASPSPGPSDGPAPEPSATPSPTPSDTPTPEPTDGPTPEPTATPSPTPSDTPTPEPTDGPTPEPSPTEPAPAPPLPAPDPDVPGPPVVP